MSEQNYYEEKLNEIRSLLESDIDKADSLLDVELNMPYIPEKYEVQFVALKDKIIFKQADSIKNTSLTEEEVVSYLFSGNDIKEAAAIDSLAKINVRNVLEDVLKWLKENGEDKPIARAFIYEILVSQEINVELEFDGIPLNPTINKSILDDNEVRIALSTFENEVEEVPHMLQALIDEFRHYLLLSFPHLPRNGEAFAKDFSIAFKAMFDEKIELTDEQLKIQDVIKS